MVPTVPRLPIARWATVACEMRNSLRFTVARAVAEFHRASQITFGALKFELVEGCWCLLEV